MKTLRLLLVSLTLAAAVLASGCAQLDRAYETQIVTMPAEIIRTNTVIVTNFVPVTVTDPATGQTLTQTNAVLVPVVTYDYAPAVTVTNLVPRAGVQGGVEFVGALPLPFAGTAAALLGLLYSTYAAVRNRKTGVALVQGIEAARLWLQQTPEGQKVDAQLVAKLKQHQEAAGVLNSVSKLVNEYTGKTTRQPT
jgi:hypothetical protein